MVIFKQIKTGKEYENHLRETQVLAYILKLQRSYKRDLWNRN
jgi:hypothetical protein